MANIALELLVILGLTLVNAFFSAAEVAILSVRKSRLRELVQDGLKPARAALRLKEGPERFLATVQVGITVVGASAGAFGGATLEGPVSRVLTKIGLGAASDDLAFALVVAFVSCLSIVIGELVPKSLALRHSERVALTVSPALDLLARISRPIIWFLTSASNVLLRPFKDQTTFTEARLSLEELQELEAFSVMVPLSEIAWLATNAEPERIEATLRTQPHARYPVLDETAQPVGYVLAHEVYEQLLDDALDLRRLLREIPTFHEHALAGTILHTLQRVRSEIGLIVDDRGAVSGLISIESLAEELIGQPTRTLAPMTPVDDSRKSAKHVTRTQMTLR
jgi:putative hemolysin